MPEFFEQPEWKRPFDVEDRFLKRIHPEYVDHETGDISPTQFKNLPQPDRFSVDWEQFSSVEAVLGEKTTWGVIYLEAQIFWDEDQEIIKSPLCDVQEVKNRFEQGRTNIAHCDVVGEKQHKKGRRDITTERMVRLAEAAATRWLKRESW